MSSVQDQAALYIARQLDKGGISPKSLEIIAENSGNKRVAEGLRAVARDVALGKPLVKSLHNQRALPTAFIAAIGAGGSRTVQSLTLAVRGVRDYHRALTGAALRATCLLFAALAAVCLGAFAVLPVMKTTLEESGATVPLLWSVSSISLRIVAGPVGLCVVITLVFLAIRCPGWLARIASGRYHLAPYRTATFRALSLLLRVGFSIHEALPLVGSVCGSSRFRKDLETAGQRISGGRSVRDAFIGLRLSPPELNDLWDIARGNDALSEVATGFAEMAAVESELQQARISNRLRTAYALCAGIVVLWAAATIGAGFLRILECLTYG